MVLALDSRAVRRTLPIAVVAAAALALAPPAPTAGFVRLSCFPPRTRTVFQTAAVRVYYTAAREPFGCLRARGRRVPLDRFVDPYYTPGDARLGQLRLAGETLGYTWIDPGIPAVYVHSVNLRFGLTLRRVELTPVAILDPAAVAVTSLAVRGSGALAWIQRLEGETSVWRSDRRGLRRLDVGAGIAPTSLRLRRTRLTWRNTGVVRRATLR
jgi:hypothetical protein